MGKEFLQRALSYVDGKISEDKQLKISKKGSDKPNAGLSFSMTTTPHNKDISKNDVIIHTNFNLGLYNNGIMNLNFIASNESKSEKKFSLNFSRIRVHFYMLVKVIPSL